MIPATVSECIPIYFDKFDRSCFRLTVCPMHHVAPLCDKLCFFPYQRNVNVSQLYHHIPTFALCLFLQKSLIPMRVLRTFSMPLSSITKTPLNHNGWRKAVMYDCKLRDEESRRCCVTKRNRKGGTWSCNRKSDSENLPQCV
jgi:hypothetical protein